MKNIFQFIIKTLFLILVFFAHEAISEQCQPLWEISDIADKLTDQYNRSNDFEEFKTNVKLEIHVQQIVSLSSINGEFLIDLFFSEIWTDPKLDFKYLNLCSNNITLNAEFENRIWVPGICISNAKLAFTHHSPGSNDFLILYTDGTVWRNYRMRIRYIVV